MVYWSVVALVLQVAGSVVVVVEYHHAHRRWTKTFGTSEVSLAGTVQRRTARFGATAHPVAPNEETFEERIARIESRIESVQDHLISEVQRVEADIPRRAAVEAQRVEDQLQPQIAFTLRYLSGMGERHKWNPWWLGPALLLAGTLIGGIVGVATATTTV